VQGNASGRRGDPSGPSVSLVIRKTAIVSITSDLTVQGQEQAKDPIRRIVRTEVIKIARRSFLLYLANLVIVIVGVNIVFFFLGSYLGSPFVPILQVYAVVVTAYSGFVYYQARSRPTVDTGTNFYAVGLLGLTLGTLLFVWGAYQLLSAGYWIRQARGGSPAKCGVDGGEVVAYGQGGLVCMKGSHLVTIGWNVPKKWTWLGLTALAAGIFSLVANSYVPSILTGGLGFISYSLFIIGITFLYGLFFGRTAFGGPVRLPPGPGQSENG
jgi:hypothetical protein